MIFVRPFALIFLFAATACDSSQQSFNDGASNASASAANAQASALPEIVANENRLPKSAARPAAVTAQWAVSPFGSPQHAGPGAPGTAPSSEHNPAQNSQTEDGTPEPSVSVVAYSNLVPVETHDYPGAGNSPSPGATPGRPPAGQRPGDLAITR